MSRNRAYFTSLPVKIQQALNEHATKNRFKYTKHTYASTYKHWIEKLIIHKLLTPEIETELMALMLSSGKISET